VKHLGKKVHVLENNEGLLERDFATYAPFYASFGLSCAKSIDGTSDICYCLKRENNAYFNAAILRGQLELGDTVRALPLPRTPYPLPPPPPPTATTTRTPGPTVTPTRT